MRPYVKLLKGPPTPKSFEPEIQASIESLPHNVARLEARMRDLILESEPVYASESALQGNSKFGLLYLRIIFRYYIKSPPFSTPHIFCAFYALVGAVNWLRLSQTALFGRTPYATKRLKLALASVCLEA
jgi:hypothetical protein